MRILAAGFLRLAYFPKKVPGVFQMYGIEHSHFSIRTNVTQKNSKKNTLNTVYLEFKILGTDYEIRLTNFNKIKWRNTK
jgi:hypothetical protein